MGQITQAQTDHLLRHGYVLLPDFLTRDELDAARSDMFRYFPSPHELP